MCECMSFCLKQGWVLGLRACTVNHRLDEKERTLWCLCLLIPCGQQPHKNWTGATCVSESPFHTGQTIIIIFITNIKIFLCVCKIQRPHNLSHVTSTLNPLYFSLQYVQKTPLIYTPLNQIKIVQQQEQKSAPPSHQLLNKHFKLCSRTNLYYLFALHKTQTGSIRFSLPHAQDCTHIKHIHTCTQKIWSALSQNLVTADALTSKKSKREERKTSNFRESKAPHPY